MAASTLPGGSGITANRWRAGFAVGGGPDLPWRHPWSVSTGWHGSAWCATIKPGFVNGRCPIWRSAAGDVPLYQTPALPLLWRPIGWDGGPGSAVPQFFLDLGAANSPESADDESFDPSATLSPPAGLRLVRVSDLWVHQPRAGLTSNVTITADVLGGSSLVTQTLSESAPAANDALQVMTGELLVTGTASPETIAGQFDEQTWDEILLAKGYALSPPNAAIDSDPDATWSLYVAHSLFWNLHYQAGQLTPPPQVAGLAVNDLAILAGGAASFVIQSEAAEVNDGLQAALNAVAANTLAGKFWTPTAGGSTSLFPPVAAVPAQGATGLDKDGRLAAQQQAAAVAPYLAQLDPPYPYTAAAFTPALLSSAS